MRYIILLVGLFLTFSVAAVEDDTPPPPQVDALPEQPDIPSSAKSGEVLKPDITIIRKGKNTIQEYRRSGKVYMIKVVPDIGPPYYFVDTDGDGNVDVNRGARNLDPNVNMWKIYEWD